MCKVIKQGACPYCPSSDAFTEYEDGGYHCFSCQAHSSGNKYKKVQLLMQPKAEDKRITAPFYPEDAKRWLPCKILTWISRYGITDAERYDNHFLYSPSTELLIFPVFGPYNELLMWQGRYFGNKPTHPKYLTRGNPESIQHILGNNNSYSIVLTEDLISAIKVSRQFTAMPLWGSSLSANQARRLAQRYDTAYLWLDYDKREQSIKQAIKHCLTLHIDPIITDRDPKAYSDEDIKTYLTMGVGAQSC